MQIRKFLLKVTTLMLIGVLIMKTRTHVHKDYHNYEPECINPPTSHLNLVVTAPLESFKLRSG